MHFTATPLVDSCGSIGPKLQRHADIFFWCKIAATTSTQEIKPVIGTRPFSNAPAAFNEQRRQSTPDNRGVWLRSFERQRPESPEDC